VDEDENKVEDKYEDESLLRYNALSIVRPHGLRKP
jgi:hypothetical protein